MAMRTIEDLSMLVNAKTTAMKHKPSLILLNLKLNINKLWLHGYYIKLKQLLNKYNQKAVRLITELTFWTALVRFTPKLLKTVRREWLK